MVNELQYAIPFFYFLSSHWFPCLTLSGDFKIFLYLILFLFFLLLFLTIFFLIISFNIGLVEN